LLVAINAAMGIWSHRLPFRIKLEQIRASHDANIVFVGNSLLDGRIDHDILARTAKSRCASLNSVNAALGAVDPPEQRLLFNYARRLNPGIRTVVVGFFDFQLTASDNSRAVDLIGNRLVGVDRRFSAREVASAYNFGLVDRATMEILRWSPMAAYRGSAWKEVELLRRSMGTMGMPAVATNSMGRVSDFAGLEAADTQAFDKHAADFLDNLNQFNRSYEWIFDQAARSHTRVVLLLMPMSPYHRSAFYSRPAWPKYLAAIESLAAQRGYGVIDASEWIPNDDDFADHLHMTINASKGFTARVGSALTAMPDR
jgi:hypothetical protein